MTKYILVNPTGNEVIQLSEENWISALIEALETLDCYVEERISYLKRFPDALIMG